MYSYNIFKKELCNFLNENEKDIIRKDIYEFNKLINIIDYLPPLYLEKNKYFNVLFKEKNIFKLLYLVCTEYLKNINKTYEEDNELFNLSIKLINKFYDVFKPINLNNKYIVIYPKLSIKKYITQVKESEDFRFSYISEKTLEKLIYLIIKFSEFELSNIDKRKFGEINLPSLVLANIKLYEKGILKIYQNEDRKIEFYLTKINTNKANSKIIKDNEYIMYKIIEILCKNNYGSFTACDFMK